MTQNLVSNPAPKAVPHVYIAVRAIPYIGDSRVAVGSVILDVKDDEGAVAVVAIPQDILEQVIQYARPTSISCVQP